MERSPWSDATPDADGSIENPIAQLNAARSRSLIDNSLSAPRVTSCLRIFTEST